MREPVKALHVVRSLRYGGGVQAWLLECVRRTAGQDVHFDVFSMLDCVDMRDEFCALGSEVASCAGKLTLRNLKASLSSVLRKRQYQIVHSHCEYYDGLVLGQAYEFGVPVRISHSHTSVLYMYRRSSLVGRLWKAYLQRRILKYATHGFAVSSVAGRSLFQRTWAKSDRFRVSVPCGIDLFPYEKPIVPDNLREQLRIPRQSRVVGNVGRFDVQKNHTLMVKIASEVLKTNQQIHFVFIGDGRLKARTQEQVCSAEIGPNVHFLGNRDDVPDLLRGVIDIFLFPSHSEGLGLALIEAQAAGLQCVISDAIPIEAEISHELCHRMKPDSTASDWAKTVLAILNKGGANTNESDPLKRIAVSKYEVNNSVHCLFDAYDRVLEDSQ